MRKPAKQKAQSRSRTIQPPTRGWIANEPLANSKPGGALVLENWFPQTTSARIRGGSQRYATISNYDFSRASTATYYTSNGGVAYAANDVIRKDVDPVTGVDDGFLLEAAATNLLLRSEQFDNAAWTTFGTPTVTANNAVAPDGATTADKFVGSASDCGISQVKSSLTSGAAYTFSVWLRADAATTVNIYLISSGNTLAACSLTTLWQRFTVTRILGATSATCQIGGAGTGIGKTFYMWGGQLEAGTAATSYIPTTTAAATRAADIYSATPSPVRRLFSYKSGSQTKFFASDESKIFDITTVLDPDIMPVGVVTGQTSGYYATAQFGNAGGDYLMICNGSDTPRYFDGSVWASNAFTGITTPANLSFVWSFASRLWYVEKNTMNAWYLAIDAIDGAMTKFSLAGVFQGGGYLLFGGKWSLDSGDGLDDKCFFVSSTGEVAIYQGSDPSDATTWSKVGTYKITPPMGINALEYAGGEPLIGVQDGIVPLSAAVQKDEAALELAAVTKNIAPEWKLEVQARSSLPWEILKWPTMNMMIVSLPVTSDDVDPYCFVCNVETGAWCKFTNWNTRCLGIFQDSAFFGTNDGRVFRMETGGSDDGNPYECS